MRNLSIGSRVSTGLSKYGRVLGLVCGLDRLDIFFPEYSLQVNKEWNRTIPSQNIIFFVRGIITNSIFDQRIDVCSPHSIFFSKPDLIAPEYVLSEEVDI